MTETAPAIPEHVSKADFAHSWLQERIRSLFTLANQRLSLLGSDDGAESEGHERCRWHGDHSRHASGSPASAHERVVTYAR